jgi:hypothetical protein
MGRGTWWVGGGEWLGGDVVLEVWWGGEGRRVVLWGRASSVAVPHLVATPLGPPSQRRANYELASHLKGRRWRHSALANRVACSQHLAASTDQPATQTSG